MAQMGRPKLRGPLYLTPPRQADGDGSHGPLMVGYVTPKGMHHIGFVNLFSVTCLIRWHHGWLKWDARNCGARSI
jgi:hypothetical protein